MKSSKVKRIPVVIVALGALLSVGGVYVLIDVWLTNRRLEEAARVPVIVDASNPQSRQDAEGRDEKSIAQDSLDTYAVGASMPRILSIDTIGVRARIVPMEVNPDSSIQAPLNIFDSGWYTGSAKPGQDGAVVIDGHASGPTRKGLFAYLDTLSRGDTVKIERGDGVQFTYRVMHTETVQLDAVDMKTFLAPYGGVKKGLNLMTCTGKWNRAQATYDHRVIVYTEQIGA